MFPIDIQEQKRYTKFELLEIFDCSENRLMSILRKLKEYGVVKTVKISKEQINSFELLNEDVIITDISKNKDDSYYVFTYVGVVIIKNFVIRCFPKYLFNNEKPKENLKQIIKVIEKYNSKEEIIYLENQIDDTEVFNLLSLMLFLIDDYHKNGLYTHIHNFIDANNDGEILWDKTINETYAFIVDNTPYYLELYTKNSKKDDLNYFKLLHEIILTKCSKELEKADLLDLFDLTSVELTDRTLESFDDSESILYKINQEISSEYNSHKQILLKTFYAYVSNKHFELGDLDCFSMYGTTSYNLIWEKMCSFVLNDKKGNMLKDLNLPTSLKEKYDGTKTLSSIIEKPFWYGFDDEKRVFKKRSEYTLKPDILTIYQNKDNEFEFIILDAKYYNLQLEYDLDLKGQPEIESITKQYMYELCFKEFVNENGFSEIKNCFLFPTEKNEIINKGYVELNFLHKIPLKNIQLILLPANLINEYYLNEKLLDISCLKLKDFEEEEDGTISKKIKDINHLRISEKSMKKVFRKNSAMNKIKK